MNEDFKRFFEQRTHLSASTATVQRRWLRDFESFIQQQGHSWKATTAATLDDFERHLLWRTNAKGGLYSPNSVDQALRTVRAFFRWALAQKLVTKDPGAKLIMPRPPQPDQPVLTRDQILALLNVPDLSKPTGIRDALILELLYAFPMTVVYCASIQLDHVDGDFLWIQERRHPLDETRAAMKRYLELARPQLSKDPNQSTLLLTLFGQPILQIWAIVRRYGNLLGLPKTLNARTLRRSYHAHTQVLEKRLRF